MVGSNQSAGHEYFRKVWCQTPSPQSLHLISFNELRFPVKASFITSNSIADHYALCDGADKTIQVLYRLDKSPCFTLDLELQLELQTSQYRQWCCITRNLWYGIFLAEFIEMFNPWQNVISIFHRCIQRKKNYPKPVIFSPILL